MMHFYNADTKEIYLICGTLMFLNKRMPTITEQPERFLFVPVGELVLILLN